MRHAGLWWGEGWRGLWSIALAESSAFVSVSAYAQTIIKIQAALGRIPGIYISSAALDTLYQWKTHCYRRPVA